MRRREKMDTIGLPIPLATSGVYYNGELLSSSQSSFGQIGDSVISSDCCIDEKHPGPPYISGGPLNVRHFRSNYLTSLVDVNVHSNPGYLDWFIEGPVIGLVDPANYLDWTDPSSEILDDGSWCNPSHLDDGVKGWNRAAPGKPEADIATALGEAQEIVPMIQQTVKSFAKAYQRIKRKGQPYSASNAADDWLNFNFGWLPFLNDIIDFINVVQHQEDLIYQLRKDNAKWVYRRRSVRREEQVEQVYSSQNVPGHIPAAATQCYTYPLGNIRGEKVTRLNSWFVGRFKYYIPYLKTKGPVTTREMVHLLGLKPTPMMVYNLLPWSWLLDWATNVGDSFANFQSIFIDGVVSKYAYVMSHKTQRVTFEYYSNYKGTPLSTINYAEIEQKLRSPALPFGFTTPATSFSDRQWSILAALGISRNRVLSRTL